jgi:serine/threonine protein phosphatase PrpC
VIVLAVAGDRLFWISVGDSPLYLYRGGQLVRLNDDHSMAPQIDLMARQGIIDAETARTHPQRNCLTSALIGADIPEVDCPDAAFDLRPGDLVVAASDGLQFLPDAAIGGILKRARRKSSGRIADALIAGVERLADPDQDNVSLVVIKAGADARLTGSPVRRHLGGLFGAWQADLAPARAAVARDG